MSSLFTVSNIHHNLSAQRFECSVDGQLCECSYLLAGKLLTLPHTYVPAALAGRGIAAALVQAVLEWAQAQDYSVQPSCSYVRAYMAKRPELTKLLAV
jgi:uncharacterized protein